MKRELSLDAVAFSTTRDGRMIDLSTPYDSESPDTHFEHCVDADLLRALHGQGFTEVCIWPEGVRAWHPLDSRVGYYASYSETGGYELRWNYYEDRYKDNDNPLPTTMVPDHVWDALINLHVYRDRQPGEAFAEIARPENPSADQIEWIRSVRSLNQFL